MRGSRNNKTTTLSQGLRSLMSSLDKTGKLKMAGIIEVWDGVAGPEIAAHTFVSGLKEGVLVVHVDSPVWAAELTAMAEQLRQRLEEESGQRNVKALRFTVSRRVGLERKESASQKRAEQGYGGEQVTPASLTENELAVVRRSVATIKNEVLRDAALRATVADLEWKKGQEKANSAQAAPGGPQDTRKAP